MRKKRSPTRRPKKATKQVRRVSRRRSNSPRGLPAAAAQIVGQEKGAADKSREVQSFRMETRDKRVMLMMTAIVVFGLLSIYFYIDILVKLRNYYTLILVIPLYGYVFGDLIAWLWRGIRVVELNATGFTIIRRNMGLTTHIGLAEVGSVRVTKSVDGKAVNILLHGAQARKFLWMEFYSGPRVRIAESTFDKGEFAEFISRASALRLAGQQH
ncbi:MAG TPA: hypothetical protein VI758_05505 [Bacteroidota bacterium]